MNKISNAPRANGEPKLSNADSTGLSGEEQLVFAFAKNGKHSKARPRETWIEAGRASVRRTKDGGLCVERHFVHLTQLPPKNMNTWHKRAASA